MLGQIVRPPRKLGAGLSNAIVLRIEYGPLHSVAGHPIARQLIAQQVPILAKYHPIDVFDYERFR